MIGYLSHTGYIVPVATLKKVFGGKYQNLLRELTIVHRPRVGAVQRTRMYELVKHANADCLRLPRSLAAIFDKRNILRTKLLLSPLRFIAPVMQLDLFENQELVTRELCSRVFTQEKINVGTATCILDMRAGVGKTFVAAEIISRIRLRTLYVVPKRPLAAQAVKDLRACYYPTDGTKPTVTVGYFDKKTERATDPSSQDVTVIVINSALLQSPVFFSGYSFVILDEVHSYCSDKRKKIFAMCTHACLGMTATAHDRADGRDRISHKELGEIIKAEDVDGFSYEDVKFTCAARVINYYGPPEHTENLIHPSTQLVFVSYMYNQFIGDPHRMDLAVAELEKLYDWRGAEGQKHHIYVFAEELECLRMARDAFLVALEKHRREDIKADSVCLEDTGMFVGGLKENVATTMIGKARVLFSTYGYAGTGISILNMTAMLLLTPRKASMKQIFARILRRGSDESIPRIIVDIVDKNTCLARQVGARRLAREFYGFTEETIKVTAPG